MQTVVRQDTITVNPQLTLTAVLNKDITCSLPTDAQITQNQLVGLDVTTNIESAGTYVTTYCQRLQY
jgi:hypothetical protein